MSLNNNNSDNLPLNCGECTADSSCVVLKQTKPECNEQNDIIVVDIENENSSLNDVKPEIKEKRIYGSNRKIRNKTTMNEKLNIFIGGYTIGGNTDIEEQIMDDNNYVSRIRSRDNGVIGYRCKWHECDHFGRKMSKVYEHVFTRHCMGKAKRDSNNHFKRRHAKRKLKMKLSKSKGIKPEVIDISD